MSKLFEGINTKLYHMRGISADQVIDAETHLGLRFSDDYRNYLMEYGVVSFGSHEFMGIGGDAYLDVVSETIRERTNRDVFPMRCYIIENIGIDGILILQNEEGEVFELSDSGCKQIADSLAEYIRSID